MENKLKELIGKLNVWLYVKSSNGWIKNVEILEVNEETVTFLYEHESSLESKVWEKTTRIDNIAEVDVRVLALPKDKQQIAEMRQRLIELLDRE